MDYQTNGPSHSGNDGMEKWIYVLHGGHGYKLLRCCEPDLFAYVWDYETANWDLINANNRTKILFLVVNHQITIRGQYPVRIMVRSIQSVYLDIPVDGLFHAPVEKEYMSMTHLMMKLKYKFRLRNSPKEDDGYSTDLRTEIRNLNLSVRDEEVAPSNPSNTGYFSSVSGNPDFIYDYWTTTNGFNYETDDEAIDSCDQFS